MMDDIREIPIEKPPVINAITSKLEGDAEYYKSNGVTATVVAINEIEWIVKILNACREYVKHHAPTEAQKHFDKAGDEQSKQESSSNLIKAILSDVEPD